MISSSSLLDTFQKAFLLLLPLVIKRNKFLSCLYICPIIFMAKIWKNFQFVKQIYFLAQSNIGFMFAVVFVDNVQGFTILWQKSQQPFIGIICNRYATLVRQCFLSSSLWTLCHSNFWLPFRHFIQLVKPNIYIYILLLNFNDADASVSYGHISATSYNIGICS